MPLGGEGLEDLQTQGTSVISTVALFRLVRLVTSEITCNFSAPHEGRILPARHLTCIIGKEFPASIHHR